MILRASFSTRRLSISALEFINESAADALDASSLDSSFTSFEYYSTNLPSNSASVYFAAISVALYSISLVIEVT
jgi:hypothetical protein